VPAGTQPGARIGRPVGSHSISILLSPSQRFRLYTGEADPADHAHFTMKYDVDGELGTIDGRLLDQARDFMNRTSEGVEFRVRDGPALAGRPHPPGMIVWPGMPGDADQRLRQVYGYRAFPDPPGRYKTRRREQVEAWGPVPLVKE
jgi:hypothetical protein